MQPDDHAAEREQPRVELQHSTCPYCKDAVRPDDPKAACDACMAWHHHDCWSEHGSCSACGAAKGVGEDASATPRASGGRPLCSATGCERPVLRSVADPLAVTLSNPRERRNLTTLCVEHGIDGVRVNLAGSLGLGLLMLVGSVFMAFCCWMGEGGTAIWVTCAVPLIVGLIVLATRRQQLAILRKLEHEHDPKA